MRSAMASFLNAPEDEQPSPSPARDQSQRLASDLREEVLGPDDRPGDQVGEEQDEQQEVVEAPLGLDLPPVDVHRVVDRLERVERDAHRQDDLERPGSCTNAPRSKQLEQ